MQIELYDKEIGKVTADYSTPINRLYANSDITLSLFFENVSFRGRVTLTPKELAEIIAYSLNPIKKL